MSLKKALNWLCQCYLALPANALFPLLFYQLTFLECAHYKPGLSDGAVNCVFHFNSMIFHWIKQQRPGTMVCNPNSALGLGTVCSTGPESGPSCILLSTSNLPGFSLLSTLQKVTISMSDDGSCFPDQIQFTNPSQRLQPVPVCVEVGYLISQKQAETRHEWLAGLVSNESTYLWDWQARSRQAGSLLGAHCMFHITSAFYRSTARVNVIRAVTSWPAPDMNRN